MEKVSKKKVISGTLKLFLGSAVLMSCLYGADATTTNAKHKNAQTNTKAKQAKAKKATNKDGKKEGAKTENDAVKTSTNGEDNNANEPTNADSNENVNVENNNIENVENVQDSHENIAPKAHEDNKASAKEENSKKDAKPIDRAAKKTGVIIGVNVGAAIDTTITPSDVASGDSMSAALNNTYAGAEFGIKAGYQYYFTRVLGLRAYGSYGYSVLASNTPSVSVSGGSVEAISKANGNRFDVDVDVLLDLLPFHYFSAGLIVGLYGGYNGVSTAGDSAITTSFSGGQFGTNLGIQMTIASHHRLELVGKIPFNGIPLDTGNETANKLTESLKLRYVGVSLGYTYTF